jgi:deoxycytidylate deaminase
MGTTRYHVTAVITDRKGNTLSIGQNSYVKTHPLQALHASKVGMPEKTFLHAEVHAIVRCKALHKAHKIFVSRWDKNGNPVNAKPCKICMSAIKATGITEIEYT